MHPVLQDTAGYIDASDIRNIMHAFGDHLGEKLSEEEIEAVIMTLKCEGDHHTTPGQIVKAMEETRSFRGLASRPPRSADTSLPKEQ